MTDARARRLLLLAALGARLLVIPFTGGLVAPDEVFQMREPAHQLAFGVGVLPWEWDAGLRSWLVPGLLGALYRFTALLVPAQGLTGALALVGPLAFALISLLVVDASERLARLAFGARAGLTAGVAAALAPFVLYFAPRTLGDAASAAFLLWGFAALAEAPARAVPPRGALWAGLAFGAAFAFRPTAPIFLAGVLAGLAPALARGRRVREAERLAAGFLLVVIALGLADWLAWGKPFHSLGAFARFNLIEGRASRYGTAPPWGYAKMLATALGPAFPLVLATAILGAARLPSLGAGLLVGLLAMSLVAHKEERFLLPIILALPVLLTAGAFSLAARWPAHARWLAPTLLALALASPSFAFSPARRDASPHGDLHEALRTVGAQSDAGAVLVSAPWQTTGGVTLLGRDIPMVARAHLFAGADGRAALDNPLVNYLVVPDAESAELAAAAAATAFEVAARHGSFAVMRRRISPSGPSAAPAPR